ncbi:MAG: NapC/NirT family cytochrome c [Coriobacteriales bacterium]|nr:NapC/NirT family cytochrome c [Coriobacteriales bacterium]
MGIALAILASIAIVAAGLVHLAASPTVCGSCHEMRPSVASWSVSPHARVACPACHETPRPLYQFPEVLVERSTRLRVDIVRHVGAEGANVAEADIPDSRCVRCHAPSRMISIRYGTRIDHWKHAKRNGSCLSCHADVAHPASAEGRRLRLMQRCFTCHSRAKDAKAPGTCDVCHPKSFALRPDSHDPSSWRSRHGASARTDRKHCQMCHDESYCRDCHGLAMPHPKGWAAGTGASGHGAFRGVRRVCVRCHTQRDMCGACHHKRYKAGGSRWVDQHPAGVKQRGAASCMECHQPMFCPECHVFGPRPRGASAR